jgi:lipoate-protein ligase A
VELLGNTNLNIPFKKIRIIPLKHYSGNFNMAIDYYFSEQMQKINEPVLRFYGWKPFCLSLGRHQDVNTVNIKKLISDGFDLVRRPTGGSAIFHSDELTYSIVVPKNLMHHKELYFIMHQILYRTLRKLGYNVEFHIQNDAENYLKNGNATFICFNRSAYTEIKYNGKKLVGSAQKIFSDSILQHGSILIDKTQNKIVEYFGNNADIQKENLEYLTEHATSLNQISDKKIDIEKLSVNIIADLKESLEIYLKSLSEEEFQQAKKYCSEFTVKNIT